MNGPKITYENWLSAISGKIPSFMLIQTLEHYFQKLKDSEYDENEPRNLDILRLLSIGSFTPYKIAKYLGVPNSSLQYRLSKFEKTGLVQFRNAGKWTTSLQVRHYRITSMGMALVSYSRFPPINSKISKNGWTIGDILIDNGIEANMTTSLLDVVNLDLPVYGVLFKKLRGLVEAGFLYDNYYLKSGHWMVPFPLFRSSFHLSIFTYINRTIEDFLLTTRDLEVGNIDEEEFNEAYLNIRRNVEAHSLFSFIVALSQYTEKNVVEIPWSTRTMMSSSLHPNSLKRGFGKIIQMLMEDWEKPIINVALEKTEEARFFTDVWTGVHQALTDLSKNKEDA